MLSPSNWRGSEHSMAALVKSGLECGLGWYV
jgi:hypothetical protein